MKIVITGGTGFVGPHLAEHLLSLDRQPILLARGRDLRHPPAASVIHTDLSDPGLLVEAIRGCDAIAHCAGINRETGSQTYRRVHVEGTRTSSKPPDWPAFRACSCSAFSAPVRIAARLIMKRSSKLKNCCATPGSITPF